MTNDRGRVSGVCESRRKTATFLSLQLAIMTAGGVWAAQRVQTLGLERELPVPRNVPLCVGPLYDYPDVVSDDELHCVLAKLRPRLRGKHPKINYVDHALRFWGLDAKFDDPLCLSGKEMQQLLLDHHLFADAWGTETEPLLIDTDAGVRVRVQHGLATSSHVDHVLAALAEAGTPLEFQVRTASRQTTLKAIFEQSLRDFSLNQVEYEWSTLAYALYLPPTKRWVSSEGQDITFDLLSERIMRQELPQGVCYGNHRMHALVMLLRIDEHWNILSQTARVRIVEYLKGVTRSLVQSQHADGYWTRSWPGTAAGQDGDRDASDNVLRERILATGHPMEWWALAPEELHPPREYLVRAGQWLCHTVEELTPEQVQAEFAPLSHVGRALALWRGLAPSALSLGN